MLPGSPEFVIADLACAAFGLVSVPLASDNDERISQLVESCDLGLIICLERTLDRLLGLKKGGRMITLRHVVIVGAAPRPPEIRKAGQVGILLYGFEDLVLRGYRSMMVAKPLSGDSHFSIVASTGDEEWAISNSNIICATHVIRDDVGVNLGPADCMFIQSRGSGLSRTAIWTAIGSGASIAFPSSDVEVFEELQGLKAAVLVADPDFLKRTVRTIRKSLKDDAERARFERTYQTVEQSGDISGSKSEELAPFRKILGGNIRSLLVPGPVDPESLNFWRVMLGVRAFVFYGSDGGVPAIGSLTDPAHTLRPSMYTDLALRFLDSGAPNQASSASGELVARGPCVWQKYDELNSDGEEWTSLGIRARLREDGRLEVVSS